MSEIAKSKIEIESELSKINQVNQIIASRLDSAKASGNTDEYGSLINDLQTNKDREDFLQNSYTKLMSEEENLKVADVSKLTTELRQPVSAPMANYMSMSGTGLPSSIPLSSGRESVKEQQQRQREIVGQIFNAPVGSGGVQAEQLPAGVRAGIGALPTPESKLEYIKRTYPDANITPMSVGGNTEFLIKNKDGSTLTTLDKGVAGIAGMLAVETPIALAETAAGIGVGLATKSPIAGNLAAGTTRATLGPIADSITRAALGMPQNITESIGRRGIEAGIGMALGGISDVAIPAIRAKRIPSKFSNEFLKTFQNSVKELGLPESAVPAGAQFGRQGLEAAQDIAARVRGSGLADNYRKTQESVVNIFGAVKDGIPLEASDFASIAINQQSQRKALSNSIAQANKQSKVLIDEAVNRLLKPRANVDVDKLGGIFRDAIQSAENQAIKSTNDQYALLSEVADSAGFNIRAEDLLGIVSKIKQQVNPKKAFDESATNGVENRLRSLIADQKNISNIEKRITGEKDIAKLNQLSGQIESIKKRGILNFKNFDDYIKAFNDARPDNAVGGTTKDALGAKISSELSSLRRDIYSKFNAILPDGRVANLGDEFERATELVKARGAYEKNTLGSILKEAAGEQSKTPRDIVSAVMKEPSTIDRVLQSARELELADPTKVGTASQLQEMMGQQYLHDLGIGSNKGVTNIAYDKGMLKSLYAGKEEAVARGLDSLNDKLRVLKSASIPKMTLTDLNELSSALGTDARNKVAESIVKRDILQKQQDELVRSSIFKAAKKGDFKNIDPDVLSKSILSKSSTIADAKAIMVGLNKASPESRQLFTGDFMRNLLEEYPGGNYTAAEPYTRLFDTKKFVNDFESPTGKSQLAQKLETVLGEKQSKFIYNIAKVYEGSTIPDIASGGLNARAIGTPAGATFIAPIGPIVSAVKDRYLATMLSTGSGRYRLKSALARNSLPGEINDAYVKMFRDAFLTREGLTSLAHQASSDPEFSAELLKQAREFKEKEDLNLQTK